MANLDKAHTSQSETLLNYRQWHLPWQPELTDSLTALNSAILPDSNEERKLALLKDSVKSILEYLENNSCCLEETFAPQVERLTATSINCDTTAMRQALSIFFGSPQHRLAAYGTLQPGESNYHIVSSIEGTWLKGILRGSVHQYEGYPRFEWNEEGEEISASILVSETLPQHLDRIDEFEGENYSRILVPVTVDDCTIVCNVYAVKQA